MSADEINRKLPTHPDGTPFTFMIVDDSEFMISNLKRIVVGLGGRVLVTATNGADAIRVYGGLTIKPDLITMDITMPVMNGREALASIRKVNPTQKIVMVSALGDQMNVRESLLSGAKHFIVKPFQRDDVFRIFGAILGDARASS